MSQEPGDQGKSNREANSNPYQKAANERQSLASIMTSILNYLFTEHWLVSILVASATGLVIYAIQDTFKIRSIWWGCVGTIVILDILVVVGFYAVDKWKSQSPSTQTSSAAAPNFFIRCLTAVGHPQDQLWFLSDTWGKQWFAYPLCALFVEFTNRNHEPCALGAYSFGFISTTNEWHTLHSFYVHPTDRFVIAYSNGARAGEIEFEDAPFRVVAEQRFAPKESRRGWVFLIAPTVQPGKICVRIRDDSHNETTNELQMPLDVPVNTSEAAVIKCKDNNARIVSVPVSLVYPPNPNGIVFNFPRNG